MTSIRVLNLYAGIGGNRKLWENVEVTAVENNEEIAAIYQNEYPDDVVLIDDAIRFRETINEYDFVFIASPCKLHSKNNRYKKRYRWLGDDALIPWIHWMHYNSKVPYCIENVEPHYHNIIDLKPSFNIGRHYFWSNFYCDYELYEPNLVGKVTGEKEKLQRHLGIYCTDKREYLRNALHPEIGKAILEAAI